MSTRILNAQGILSSNVPTGNLLWVDAVNGIDALAVRGRMTIPFKTLTAAKNAAQAGDTIMVLPGTYYEKNLLKNLVNWHFSPGTLVQYPKPGDAGEAGAIFDTSSSGTNSSVTSAITGHAQFLVTGYDPVNYVVHSSANGSVLLIEGSAMNAVDHCVKVGSGVASGQLNIKLSGRIESVSEDAIRIDGSTSEHVIVADQIVTSTGSALHVLSGGVHVVARKLFANGQPAVEVEGETGTTIIDAREIRSSAYLGVRYGLGEETSAILEILNARIYSGGDTPAVNIASEIGATLRVKLTCCVLIPDGDFSITAALYDTAVQLLGGAIVTADAHENVYGIGGVFTTNPDA